MFENPRRGRQAKNFTTNVPKILDLKSSSKQIFQKLSLGAPDTCKKMYNSQTNEFYLAHLKTPFHCKCQVQVKADFIYCCHCRRIILLCLYTCILAKSLQRELIWMIFYLSFLNKITMKIVANNIECVTVATDRVFFLFCVCFFCMC